MRAILIAVAIAIAMIAALILGRLTSQGIG